MRAAALLGVALLGFVSAVAGCELLGKRSAIVTQPEQRLSVAQDSGGDATSVVFQFVDANAGGLAGGFGIVMLLLLMRRARINAEIAERLVLAIERADDGKVKRAVRDAASWTRHDRVEKSLSRVVARISGGFRASTDPSKK